MDAPPIPQSEIRNPKFVTLPHPIHDAIIAHALAGKPKEVCGLLRGRNGVVTELLRADNTAANPIIDYEVDPAALAVVAFDWEDAGDELVAIYHSHPAGPAYPSATDAYQAYYPDAVFLICSLQDEAGPLLRGFLLRDLPGEIDLEAVRGDLEFEEARPGLWSVHLSADRALPPSLAHLDRPVGSALYVVFQRQRSGAERVRVVAVQEVEIAVS